MTICQISLEGREKYYLFESLISHLNTSLQIQVGSLHSETMAVSCSRLNQLTATTEDVLSQLTAVK